MDSRFFSIERNVDLTQSIIGVTYILIGVTIDKIVEAIHSANVKEYELSAPFIRSIFK